MLKLWKLASPITVEKDLVDMKNMQGLSENCNLKYHWKTRNMTCRESRHLFFAGGSINRVGIRLLTVGVTPKRSADIGLRKTMDVLGNVNR